MSVLGSISLKLLTEKQVAQLLEEVFAPWIQDLRIAITSIAEDGCTYSFPGDDRLTRGGGKGGGVVCGQAVSAVADTASVLTLSTLNGRFRACTTVDLTAHFMRPLPEGEVEAQVTALSNGRRMAVTRTEFRATGSPKLAATVTCAFAYLED
ncbi:MAG: PaaI family thioesterase [Pikeienuella sp.]